MRFFDGGGRPGGPVAAGRRLGLDPVGLVRVCRSSMSTAILVALWASTPIHTTSALRRDCRGWLRFPIQECLRWDIRPSDPVSHLMSLRKRREDSISRRVGLGRPLLGMATCFTPREERLGVHRRLAVATIGGRGLGCPSEERLDAGDGRTKHRGVRSGRVAHFDCVVDDDAIGVVGDLSFEPELDRLAETTLAGLTQSPARGMDRKGTG